MSKDRVEDELDKLLERWTAPALRSGGSLGEGGGGGRIRVGGTVGLGMEAALRCRLAGPWRTGGGAMPGLTGEGFAWAAVPSKRVAGGGTIARLACGFAWTALPYRVGGGGTPGPGRKAIEPTIST
jgi:hypothetical protein